MGILDPVRRLLSSDEDDDETGDDALEDSRRWARDVPIKRGALGGWSKDMAPRTRHGILNRQVDRGGYATVSRRLNFLCNVTKDRETRRAACGDLDWLQREFPAEEEEED